MNVGGINILDCMQTTSKASSQVDQNAFSQILTALFYNVQNSSLDESNVSGLATDSANSTQQQNNKIDLTNIILNDFGGISTKNRTENPDNIEKWISDIAAKGKQDNLNEILSAQDNNKVNELFRSIFNALNILGKKETETGTLLTPEVISQKGSVQEIGTHTELIRNLILNTGQAHENTNMFTFMGLPKETANVEELKVDKTNENSLNIINNLSTAIAQIIQLNNSKVSEGKTQQETLPGEKVGIDDMSSILSKVQLEPESKLFNVKPEIQNLTAFEELIGNTDEKTAVNKNTDINSPEGIITEVVDQESQEKPINSKIIEVLVTQIKEKLQARNPGKEIEVEDVLAIIKEVDYKKIIDSLNTLNLLSKNDITSDAEKPDFTNEIPAKQITTDTVQDINSIRVSELSEKRANTIAADLVNKEFNQTTGQKIPLPISLNSDMKTDSPSSSSTVKINNGTTDGVQNNDIFHKGTLKPNSKDEKNPLDHSDFKESLNHYINKQESINESEISVKDPEGVKVLTKHENIIEAAVKGFKSIKLPEINELRVKLKPDELGEIVVKVVLEKGQISGNITAEKREVVNILQNQMDNLKQELKSSNVNVNSISVNIGNEQGSNSSQQGFYNQNQKRERRNFENVFSNDTSEEQNEGFEIIA